MTSISKQIPPITLGLVEPNTYQMNPLWYRFLYNFSVQAISTISGTGYLIFNGSTVIGRSIVPGSTKITIANGDGVAGSTSIDVNQAALSLSSLGGSLNVSQIASVPANTFIGNPTGVSAVPTNITLGTTFQFSSGALQTQALSGDVTSSANSFVTTLSTVNSNVGTFGSATQVGQYTVNGKGLITAASNVSIQITESQVTNLTTDLGNKLTNSNNLSDVSTPATAALNLFVTRSISSVTTLASADLGKIILCSGSSAYTVTLPAHSSGKYIKIAAQTSSNALITVSPASGNINGQSTIVLGSGDTITLYDDGTNYWIISQSLVPVNCSVYLNANQSIASGSIVKITLNTRTFDIGSFFDITTNNNYIPLYPGKYQVNIGALMISDVTGTNLIGYLYKNGAAYKNNSNPQATTGLTQSVWVSDIVSMNGSTDSLDLRVLQASGANKNISGASTDTYFSASRISLF